MKRRPVTERLERLTVRVIAQRTPNIDTLESLLKLAASRAYAMGRGDGMRAERALRNEDFDDAERTLTAVVLAAGGVVAVARERKEEARRARLYVASDESGASEYSAEIPSAKAGGSR